MRLPNITCLGGLLAVALVVGAIGNGRADEPKPPAARRGPAIVSPGEKAKISLFGVTAEGFKFVYVFDRSGSMMAPGHAVLPAVKRELIDSLKRFDSVHQFQIIYYNERPKLFNPTGQPGRLVFGTDQNKTAAENFINSVTADGGTSHEDALMLAIRLHPDVIYLLTDGDDPQLTAKQLDRIDRMGAGVIINTVEFGVGPQAKKENFLVKLARQSGGQHVYVDAAKLAAEEEEKDKK